MNAAAQGTHEPGRQRYQVIPRTLIFLTSANPTTGEQEILLLKGAPTKRLWANHYNGLGGHVEAGEDVYAAARREVVEETGLAAPPLTLRGVINIDTGQDQADPRPGVMLFVFQGETNERAVRATGEGSPEWLPLEQVQKYLLVADLYEVIPRTLAGGAPFFGHYQPGVDGKMVYGFAP